MNRHGKVDFCELLTIYTLLDQIELYSVQRTNPLPAANIWSAPEIETGDKATFSSMLFLTICQPISSAAPRISLKASPFLTHCLGLYTRLSASSGNKSESFIFSLQTRFSKEIWKTAFWTVFVFAYAQINSHSICKFFLRWPLVYKTDDMIIVAYGILVDLSISLFV